VGLGHLLPQPLLRDIWAHTNFSQPRSRRVVRGGYSIIVHFSLMLMALIPDLQPQNAYVLKLAHIRLRFDSHRDSWQAHHYSGYFGMVLQLLVAGELTNLQHSFGTFIYSSY
jgi:hypothetical protein